MAKGDLTYKQRLFLEAYLGEANGNKSEAARVAGYGAPATAGDKLVRNGAIRRAIDTKLAGAAMSANEVLARLSVQAATDMDDFVSISVIPAIEPDPEKGIVGSPAHEFLTLDLVKAKKSRRFGSVKKISQTQHGLSIELYDAQSALVQLGKYHGLWQERVSIEQVEAKPVPTEEASAAIAAAKAIRDAREAESPPGIPG